MTQTTTRAVKRATKIVVQDPLGKVATNTRGVRRKIVPLARGAVHRAVHQLGRLKVSAATDTEEEWQVKDDTDKAGVIQVGPITAPQEMDYLVHVLSENFLFSDLSHSRLARTAKIFQRVVIAQGEEFITEGEPGDYFYVLYKGSIQFQIGGEVVGVSHANLSEESSMLLDEPEGLKCFGELALLTSDPRAASVLTEKDSILFRLDQMNFRAALQCNGQDEGEQKAALLKRLPVLEELDKTSRSKLVSAMTTREFSKGTVLLEKGDEMTDFFIVQKGIVTATDITWGNATYEEMKIGPGEDQQSLGWKAMTDSSKTLTATVTATTDVTLLMIEGETFKRVMGDHKDLMIRLQHKRQLACVAVFRDSKLEDYQLDALLDLMKKERFTRKTELITENKTIDASISFVRKGSVHVQSKRDDYEKILEEGAHFGQEWMLADQNVDLALDDRPALVKSQITVTANPGTEIHYLLLEDARKVVNTSQLGLGKPVIVSGIDPTIGIKNVERHKMLGAGSFGQVWLATLDNDTKEKKRIYALKVQSKEQLLESDQAEGVVAEINIMKCLKSPFIIRLYSTFQDSQRVYMLTSLLQGGELESIMSDERLDEEDARFYAAGILEGLTYMHRRHIIHRDLKPENVLINSKGYPVLIDLGFAKYVPDKTYTFCGTPMYIAPEIIQYKGHDKGVDYWSWACIVFEMVSAKYPFYEGGMAELDLFKKICRGQFKLYGFMSFEVKLLIISLFMPDPTQRLGARQNGWQDLFALSFFDGFDFNALRRQTMEAPWVPNLNDPLDSSNFQDISSNVEDKMEETQADLTEEDQKIFMAFGPIEEA